MDVDCPMLSLKRSSSAPMINQISAAMSTPSTSSSRDAVSCNIFSNPPRTRRFSTSSFGNVPRLTPRISQLRQEESVDIAGREAAHEKEIHSAMQISQSWEDLTLEAEGLSFKDSESPTQQLNKPITKRPLDPLSLNLSITGSPLCSSPSPTRSGLSQRQCYSPGIHTMANWKSSPSPTRKAFATRRSLSPIAIRPSCLGPVKRKFELDETGNPLQPPAKRTSGLLTSVASRLDMLSSPLPGTISSVGTPESLSGADSPSFSFRPVDDSPSPKMVDIKSNIVGENDSHYEARIRANSFGTGTSTPSSSSDYMTGEADSSDSKGTIPFSLKSVETMLSLSKDTSQEDLQEMVEKCKTMVLESAECSDERKWLVRRLIELRLRAQELRETSDENLFETRVILGHHFVPQKYYISTSGPAYCDHCSGAIWTMLQSWYMCSDCKFSCHWKCLNNVCRVCVHVVASEAGGYTHTKDICPEQGLSKQGYRCAECKARITFKSAWVEPRLCDYSGLYYCQRCHWNTAMVIPARVIRNWDMEPRLISRAAAQLLMLLEDRSVLPLEELNPKLFTLVPDLSLVKRMREEMQMMKRYLVLCSEACTQGLPWRIGLRTHMIENSGNYSIKDLIDLQTGTLMDELRSAYDTMHAHITQQCELCKARGHLCEICGNDEVIYPWDASSIICQQCSAVHHRVCWSKRNHCCPRCTRLLKRRALQGQTIQDGEDCDTDDTAKDS